MKPTLILTALLLLTPATWANSGGDSKAGCDVLKPDPFLNVGPHTTKAVTDLVIFGKGMSLASCGKPLPKTAEADDASHVEGRVAQVSIHQIGSGRALPEFEAKFGPNALRDFAWALPLKSVPAQASTGETATPAIGSK